MEIQQKIPRNQERYTYARKGGIATKRDQRRTAPCHLMVLLWRERNKEQILEVSGQKRRVR